MANLECNDCDLGLKFDTQEELKNHKTKFCRNSHYNDPTKMDIRLAGLKQPDPSNIKIPINDIRDFIQGKNPDAKIIPGSRQKEMDAFAYDPYGLNMKSDFASQPQRSSSTDPTTTDLERQALQLKNERLQNRVQRDQSEGNMMDLLQDLQKRKELELRAQIEKEEIARAIKATQQRGPGNLSNLERQRKQELENLANQRENIRIKEQNLLDQVSKMEADLMKDQTKFNQNNGTDFSVNYETEQRRVHDGQMNRRENELAQNRAAQVAKIKAEREKLEYDRQKIMRDLNDLSHKKTPGSRQGSRGSYRGNAAAQRAGSQVSGNNKPPSAYSNYREGGALEPSLKDKIVRDQMRINKLKEDAKSMPQLPQDLQNLDILQREIHKQQNPYDKIQVMADGFANKNIPHKGEMLKDIRVQLEQEGMGPSSVPVRNSYKTNDNKMQNNAYMDHNTPDRRQKANDDKLLSMLDDLEGLVVSQSPNKIPLKAGGRPPLNPSAHRSNQNLQVYHSMPPAQLPPWQIPSQQMSIQPQDAYMQPQQMMAPMQMQQPYDPSMNQLASLLQNQNDENRKLREVLENFGKNTSTVDQLDNQIMNTNQQLHQLQLQKDPSHSRLAGHADPMYEANQMPAEAVLPDEFLFRQNEERNTDLETEERAMMNLQAQEYDQLRVIQRLPKDSELYKFKMQQFKELSVMRAESEKLLQQQRLDKLQRDYLRQKNEEERTLEHQQWLEQQKRQVLEAKMGVQRPIVQQSVQRSQAQRTHSEFESHDLTEESALRSKPLSEQPRYEAQAGRQPTRNLLKTPQMNDSKQFMIQFDYVHHLPRQLRQLKIVSSVFRAEQLIGDPSQAGPVEAEADPNNKNLNKVAFQKKSIFQIPDKRTPDTRIIFEFQAVDPGQITGFTGLGWTWINLFDDANDLNQVRTGMWSLPIYAGPTRPQIAQGKMRKPGYAPGVTLSIRIGFPGDSLFRRRPLSYVNLDESPIPREHEGAAPQILKMQGQRPLENNQATAKFPEPDVNNIDVMDQSMKRSEKSVKDRGDLKGLDPNYETEGIKVRVNYCQNMSFLNKLTLRVSVHQGTKGPISVQGQECIFKSPTKPEPGKIDIKVGDVIGVNADGGLTIDNQDSLEKDNSFQYLAPSMYDTVLRPMDEFEVKVQRDLHKLYWDNDANDPLYLVVEVYGETAPGVGRKKVAWTIFELLKPNDGYIRYGFFDIPLLMTPLTFKKKEQQPIEGESVGFTILDINQDLNLDKRSRSRMETDASMKPSQKSVISEQFLPNFDPQNTLSGNWVDSDALDIYIDGTRHLPDNVTLTKVTAKVLDVNLNQVGMGSYGTVLLNSSQLRNQMYGMRLEVRNNKGRIPPTSILFLTIQTVDKSRMNSCIVGYSYFPLFFNIDQQMPSANNNDKNVSPLSGNYQMPLFYARPREEKPFNYERFIYLERVPTASILLRVVRAAKNPQSGLPINMSDLSPEEQQQAYIRPPQYNEGVYSTQYYSITEDERKIMTLRRVRPNAPCQRIAEDLANDLDMSLDDVQQYISNLEASPSTPQIDLTYYSQYEPGLGIRVNIEALHDNKQEGFFAVLASVMPPASYYDENRGEVKDVFYFTEPDYDSHFKTPKFSEGDALVMGFTPSQPGMSLFLDISVWNLKKNKFEPYGFTVCPLVETLNTDADEDTHEYYVSSGVFTLPVYKGSIDRRLIQQMKESTEPLNVMKSYKAKNVVQLLGTTSLIIRIVDTQRKMHFLQSFEKVAPSVKYLEPQQVATHQYKPITGGLLGGPKKMRELIPNEFKGKESKYTEFLADKFNDHVGLGHVGLDQPNQQ